MKLINAERDTKGVELELLYTNELCGNKFGANYN